MSELHDAAFEQRWQQSYANLLRFIEIYGRPPSRRQDVWFIDDDGETIFENRLKNWMTVQRKHLKEGELKESRRKLLDEAWPGWERGVSGRSAH